MYIVCACGGFALRVVGEADEIDRYINPTFRGCALLCPECKAPLHSAEHIDAALSQRIAPILREVTPHEAHLAIEGMGFPEERDCVADVVRTVLEGDQIDSISIRTIKGTGRSALDSIMMKSGATVFLGGSAWGALVYRVRSPKPTKEKT